MLISDKKMLLYLYIGMTDFRDSSVLLLYFSTVGDTWYTSVTAE